MWGNRRHDHPVELLLRDRLLDQQLAGSEHMYL